MPRCPKCGTELNEDFGMVTCPKCESVVFIDMEGQAQLAGEDQAAPVEENLPEEWPENLPGESVEDRATSLESTSESTAEPTPDSVVVEPHEPYEMFQNEPADRSPLPKEDPLGLNSYANSEFSQAKDGPLTYTLIIAGLDSKELRESLREAISDSRFAWDTAQIMASIRQGELRIESVTPVKASILINRLKRLPLKIQWEQNVVTKM